MTIKDLMIKEKSYIIELKINEKYHLFCEALSEYGETMSHKDFCEDNIIKDKFCIELIETESSEVISDKLFDCFNTLEDNIKTFKEVSIEAINFYENN